MKLTELINDFYIWSSNEEQTLLDSITEPRYISSFSEHEQVILERLIRKSLVRKIGFENPMVVGNDTKYSNS